ncbi:MAG: hypothetical protein PHQ72_06640 [Hespellia sp.]|nr:hypothetical protein [Hespellia sp.]
MTLKLTDRDKKLLIVLAVVVLVFGVGAGICYPLFQKGMELQDSVNHARDLKIENQQKVTALPSFEKTQQDLKVKVSDLQGSFYPMMKSMEIDQMLTETVLSHGVTMNTLDITMPANGTYTTLVAYDNVLNAMKEDADTSTGQQEATYDGIYTATAEVAMTGSRDAVQGAIDEFAAQEPKLRITGIIWKADSNSSEYSAQVTVEVYMYESTEEYIVEKAAAAAEEAAAE